MLVEVVCHANVCRSPVAAAFLERASGLQVRSSGLGALPGQPADPRMIRLLWDEMPALRGHRSRLFPDRTQPAPDLVLVMEVSQKRHVVELVPHLAGRTMLFGHWLDGRTDISDPFGRKDNDYVLTIERMRAAASTWIEHLSGIS